MVRRMTLIDRPRARVSTNNWPKISVKPADQQASQPTSSVGPSVSQPVSQMIKSDQNSFTRLMVHPLLPANSQSAKTYQIVRQSRIDPPLD